MSAPGEQPALNEPVLNKIVGLEYSADPMSTLATELMQRAKKGDRAAFDELVEKLRGRAFRIAQGWVGSREDALELSQDAFLKTYRARETFKDGEPFLPWFHRILRNTCFSHLRQRGSIKARSVSSHAEGDDDSSDWEIADESQPPSASSEASDRAKLFWQALNRLGARDREILSLRHFKDLPYQAIADQLEIPIGTVMSRLFNARRRLRDELAEHLEVDFGIRLEERGEKP